MSRSTVKTFSTLLEGPANALITNKNADLVAVAGRTVFKIYHINEDNFGEEYNLRVGKNLNLNFSCNDVAWNEMDENILATAATNGAVVTWNLQKQSRSKLDMVFNDHKRTVNKVCFHPSEPHILLSGSQDGRMKLFDMRKKEATSTFISNSESVRDVQFSPSPNSYFHFASVQETGNVEIWDIRRSDRPEANFIAHGGPVFACDWHPNGEKKKWLATAGRDKSIKVWDLSNTSKPVLLHCVQTIASVARIKWRPQRESHIGSCSLVVDFSIYVWDINRPFVPSAIFMEHKDVTTGFAWKNDPDIILSTSKDGTLYQHTIEDAYRPSNHYNPIGLCLNADGVVAYAISDNILRNNFSSKELIKAHSISSGSVISSTGITSSHSNNSIVTNERSSVRFSSLFRKTPDVSHYFENAVSTLMLFKPSNTYDYIDNPSNNLSMGWFVETANRYQLSGKPIGELCEYNSEIAAQLNRTQVSQMWKILMQMFSVSVRTGTQSGGTNAPAIGAANSDINENNPSRHTSGSTGRHLSGGKLKDQIQAPINDNSDNEEEDDNFSDVENFNKRNNNSHSTPQKFFMDNDVLYGEGYDSLSQNGYDYNADIMAIEQQEWELPREAIFHRHAIQDCAINPDLADTGNEPSSPTSLDDDDYNADDVLNQVSFLGNKENETSFNLLLNSEALTTPPFPFIDLVKDLLYFYALQGDVQTSVSVLLVLSDKMKFCVDKADQEKWYQSYIDLLNRFRLWNVANQVIRLCPHPFISCLNQSSTTTYSTCGQCRKSLSLKVGWLCERCRTQPSECAICRVAVKGLYMWCQGCAHGGHIEHIQQWLAHNTLCAAGCGHHCEYS